MQPSAEPEIAHRSPTDAAATVAAARDPAALSVVHREVTASGRPFLRRHDLEALEAELERLHAALVDGRHGVASHRVEAEWLSDNQYLLKRVFAQLRQDLPAGFQVRLPRLLSTGQPRVEALAEALYESRHEDFHLDELEHYLSTYQAISVLTIAEGWALPAVLRLTILRRLCADVAASMNEADDETDETATKTGRAIRALRLLAEIDWKAVFCRHSAAEQRLLLDPAGAYAAMDFETRDRYRHAVEDIAWAGRLDETAVCEAALTRSNAGDGRTRHVGHWLVGAGRRTLERELGVRSTPLETRLREHSHLTFFGCLLTTHALLLTPVLGYMIWLDATPGQVLAALLLSWIPSSIPAVALVHGLLARLVRPRALPKLDFSGGIPRQWRTLVAVPTLLGEPQDIDTCLARLEVHYLTDPDPELRFALLTDYHDCDEPPERSHGDRLAHAEAGIRRLNTRHGRERSEPFHLLHRASQWNAAEGTWMGWERKRGKLDELNRYLRGATDTSYVTHVGDPEGLADVAFVVTLDTDTQVPPGTITRLVGALAHPLNRPVVDADRRVQDGYTIIQPRVDVTPRSARASAFSRLFAGDTGIDIYTRAVSECYQDLFGEGIYVGKAIYDVDAFTATLEGRVPDNALVSHDLFEGLHARVALATDVIVYEDYPPHYAAYFDRMHRWMRGDWQLLRWLLPVVPTANGGRAPSRFRWLDRYKIADNLRRSLMAPAVLVLLLAGVLVLPGHPLFWTVVALLLPAAAALWTLLGPGGPRRRAVGRWFLSICFAPQEAATAIDAVIRVLVRTFWTGRSMLQWTTAADAARRTPDAGRAAYARRFAAGPVFAVTLICGLPFHSPLDLVWMSPWLILWLISPELARRISLPTPAIPERIDDAARRSLRLYARRVWLFFETFVGPADHWLPPDHFQEYPKGSPAHRTSPTNIGMLLLSQLAAYDLGYLGSLGLATWVSNTLDTIERLERHRGHIYNWYDTLTLRPLDPRYVSTVDSGNLLAALTALAVGCERIANDAPWRPELRAGLLDTAQLLSEAVEHWTQAEDHPAAIGLGDTSRALVDLLTDDGPFQPAVLDEAADRLHAVETELLAALRSSDQSSRRDELLLRELRMWLDRFRHQLSEAQDLAGHGPADPRTIDIATRLCELAARARRLAADMDFRFLYDPIRRLLRIGFNVTADRFDPHHYDLLASESRLASYLAVVLGHVPVEHWFALGRPLTRTRHGLGLLSWGGSMFEYLMPRLLTRSHEDTLLHESCEAAVESQIAHGRKHGVPWGTSESGFFLLDGQQSYQYKAFGVPALGLRRGLDDDLVIAPYATLLALPFRPAAVVENLRHLEALGAVGMFGPYEAIDFTPQRAPTTTGAVVRSYMSHHHGMSLVAIDNHLSNDPMVERFHADPRVASGALLLDERVPTELPPERRAVDVGDLGPAAPVTAVAVPSWEPDFRTPQTWVVGNGTLNSIVGTDGRSGLRWRDLAVNRWVANPADGGHGAMVWLLDLDDGQPIDPAPRVVDGHPVDSHVRFHAGLAELLRRHEGLAVRMRITVCQGADVELREVQVVNESHRVRRIRVMGGLEPVLAHERDADRHPAFSKLFLRCASLGEPAAVLVSRSGPTEQPAPCLLFRLVTDEDARPRLLTVDRSEFLGRRGSLQSPLALRLDPSEDAVGPTLDPLCACAVDLDMQPGASRTMTFVSAVAPTTALAISLGRRFGTAHAAKWAVEEALQFADRRIERLGTPPDLLPLVQRLLTALLVPDIARRAPVAILRVGRPGPSRLWGRGISGDDPLVVVRLRRTDGVNLLSHTLAAHRYLRALGVRVDLVLIDDTPSGYAEQRSEVVLRLLATHGMAHLLHQRGGVHLLVADQSSGHDVADLEAAALVHLDTAQGTLAHQLGRRPLAPPALPSFDPPGPPPDAPRDAEPSVVVPALDFSNGVGGFDGDEYVILPGACPPAPWSNVIANDQFGCLVTEAAMGSTWSMNAGENRLTPWRNDPVCDPPSEALYLRDEETGRVWSTTPQPVGVPTLVRHGQGYTTYEAVTDGFEHAMTVFVPPDRPVKIVRLRVRNATGRPRRLTATYYAEWVLGTRRAETRAYVRSECSQADSCLLAENSWSLDFVGRVAFLAVNRPLHGYSADRVEMLGADGDASRPAALRRWGLSGRTEPGLDPCGVLQVHVDLAPTEETELSFFLGQADDRASALALVRDLRGDGGVDRAWRASRSHWDRLLDGVRVRTPDAALDRLCNRWLTYQSLSARIFGRNAFYQSSGAFGFRDQLQDGLALLHGAPDITRRLVIDAAAHQFAEGDVLHWWHPPSGAGVRTRCSDDLLWLVYATEEYVRATGDVDILQTRIPFLVGEGVGPDHPVRFGRFGTTDEDSLLEHCRRALTRGLTAGIHGLPLIGDGDWNDGMNAVGPKGRGESVWLGWFVYACIDRFASMLDSAGDAEAEASRWRDRLPLLSTALAEHGWDGDWYRRAFHDDGAPMGSATSAPPHIDSIAQSWAALSGAAPPDQVTRALAAAERMLVDPESRLVLLLTPPFGPTGPHPGYIAAYPRGIRENGGQYSHAAAWLGWAHAARRDGNGAHRIFSLLNPLERTRTPSEVERYRVEPYVMAADVYAAPPWEGRGGWTWYTGAAAWTWRLAVEEILGLRRRHGALEVDPCLPSAWPGFEAWIRRDHVAVHVVVHNTGGTGHGVHEARLDGDTIPSAVVPRDCIGEHRLELWLGPASDAD